MLLVLFLASFPSEPAALLCFHNWNPLPSRPRTVSPTFQHSGYPISDEMTVATITSRQHSKRRCRSQQRVFSNLKHSTQARARAIELKARRQRFSKCLAERRRRVRHTRLSLGTNLTVLARYIINTVTNSSFTHQNRKTLLGDS